MVLTDLLCALFLIIYVVLIYLYDVHCSLYVVLCYLYAVVTSLYDVHCSLYAVQTYLYYDTLFTGKESICTPPCDFPTTTTTTRGLARGYIDQITQIFMPGVVPGVVKSSSIRNNPFLVR